MGTATHLCQSEAAADGGLLPSLPDAATAATARCSCWLWWLCWLCCSCWLWRLRRGQQIQQMQPMQPMQTLWMQATGTATGTASGTVTARRACAASSPTWRCAGGWCRCRRCGRRARTRSGGGAL
ncbi:hypothetical protein BC831DRAFT_283352 [Entophlyctis helioformis]|nr:hypothetical protein BC831DRAFT_283352 [Entophlyctis helioformis]